MADLSNWSGCSLPERRLIEGRYVRLEPLDAARHGDGLFAVLTMSDADQRFRFLPDMPPRSRAEFQPWLERAQASTETWFFTVIDLASDCVAGRQALMRIDAANGVIEIGHILWSAIIARQRAATEAFYLFARHVFADLGYRRLEWKCNDENEPSKRAALRFGMRFEGVFRQHLVVKVANRNTAWFSMIDKEWPRNRAAFEAWLLPENFDREGRQIRSLSEIRDAIQAEGVV